MIIVQCERHFTETITEKRYDPALGPGSPTWDEEVTVNAWNGRTAPAEGLDLSATAANSPSDLYTAEENLQRMTDWLLGAVQSVVPDAELVWTDVPAWQGNRE